MTRGAIAAALLPGFLLGVRGWPLAEVRCAVAAPPESSKVEWLTTIDEGLAQAEESGKDLLINFTSSSGSHYGTLLERAVFAQPEFAAVAEHFVLVELDFPKAAAWPAAAAGTSADRASPSDVRGDTRDIGTYRQWQSQYLVCGFPTVVVADSQGKPIAYTGYEKGIAVAGFLKSLETYRSARLARDQALQQADRLAGSERAACLDSALECVARNLGTLEERQGDALLSCYADIVTQICRLDADDALGLRSKYDRRQKALQLYVQSEGVFSKLRDFQTEHEILDYIEHVLPTITDADMIWRLEFARQVHLEWDNQHAAAIDNARRLLKRSNLTRDQQESLRDRMACNLQNLGRYTEAVAELDALIAANKDRPSRQFTYLSSRAWCLDASANTGKSRTAAIVAFQQLRARCLSGTEEWETATWGLSVQLQKSHRFREALVLRKELVDVSRTPEALLHLTETQIALGRTEDASRSLAEAERLIPMNKPARKKDTDHTERMTAKVRELRRQLGQ